MLLTALGGKIPQMRKKIVKKGGPIPVYLWTRLADSFFIFPNKKGYSECTLLSTNCNRCGSLS